MSTTASHDGYSQRVVVLPPSPQDAHICRKILDEAQIDSHFCDSLEAFCQAMKEGAGTALVAEECLIDEGIEELKQILNQQPPWSELPLLILLSSEEYSSAAVQRMLSLEHVTFLNRPLRIAIFVNKVKAKLRERQRQYDLRDLLFEQEHNRQVLYEEAQRMRMALMAGGMAAWEWTDQKSVWEDSLFELLGIKPIENPSTELFFQFVHPEDLPGLKTTWTRATSGQGRYQTEFRIVRQDGTVRWLAGVGEVIRNSDGVVVGMHGLNWDVTDRIEAEQRIRSGEERLRLALGAAELNLWEWDITTDQFYWSGIQSNPSGLVPVAPIGGLERFLEFVHEKDRQRVREALNESLRTGESYRCEYRIRGSQTSHRWVMAMGHLSMQDAQTHTQLVGIELDITQRRATEETIRLSEQRLRMAAEAGGFGMLHVSVRKGLVKYSTEVRRMIGYPEGTKLEHHHEESPPFLHPEDLEAYRRYSKEVLRNTSADESLSLDHRIVRPDGEVRWVRLQCKPMSTTGKHGTRRPSQIIGTLRDITQQREFERSLEEAREQAISANQSKSAFLANMSHEIRTPMTAILGYADLVAQRVHDDETLQFVRTIRRNGDFLLDLINDILDLSKIEAGKFHVQSERFSPNRLIEDVRSIMAVRASEKHIAFDVVYDGDVPAEIESDPKRLKQILINLVGNAIKFTDSGAVRITVRYEPPDQVAGLSNRPEATDCTAGQLKIEVRDSGIGISHQHQAHVFEAFSQADDTVSRKFGGTGLGLAISKRLTEMLGGTIQVESELGKGSTFTITVGTGDVAAVGMIRPRTTDDWASKEWSTVSKSLDCHVLVVDDRRDIRFLTTSLLKRSGAKTSEAEDGEVAVQKVKEMIDGRQLYDLILLDMQMPRLDGYQTALQLRELGYGGPIIALTANAMQGDMARCIECGCNDYLSKPIDAVQLTQKVFELTVAR